ncbi:FAD-dependent oxidoreductase [Alkalicoccobacillus plakortidis]|uniref:FAD-dependent oxidoreductase n=1 Tax=Alkalicoccobacillus plakortidis TaxID=444060 RepID=A0ABT0XFN8_9BACI|nr:FAD-dependent oxidoreductase [Alkalicoccobacillus plakortidis]MCM2674173.1 FAD-dependent oxidoreductase [Alkalicoccobacillus plakortidis]
MKVLVIGCTHAGTAAVTNIAKLHPNAEVTVYERNDNVSFLSCGIALHVGGVVKKADDLFYSSPTQLEQLGATMKMEHEVLDIDTHSKTVQVRDLKTGIEFIDHFDKLVMATGSSPIIPPITGVGLQNIQLAKNYHQAKDIITKATEAKNIAVIGAGYIGVELVEAFEAYGKHVTFIEGADRVLNKYLDEEFTEVVEQELSEHGVQLALNETVNQFVGDETGRVQKVVTSESTYDADLVLLCVGFKPQTGLLKDKVDMLPNGALIVNEYMQTSHPDIYGAGDSCAVYYNPAQTRAYIPLATNAVRMGTLVAHNLVEQKVKYRGTQGTSGLKLYDLNMASTGVTEANAFFFGLNVKTITIDEAYRPDFMPTAENVKLKLVYEVETNRLVGAQIMSKVDLTQAMNTLSACIQQNMTIEDLAFVDFFFQPHYNQPWNYLNKAALKAMDQEQVQTVLV